MDIHKSSFINHHSKRPQAYQEGYTEFYKLRFKLTPDVLIPRPETELLVDEVLNFITRNSLTILDLGTGSGNIAISIAKNLANHLPTWKALPAGNLPDGSQGQVGTQIIATDISQKALEVAKQNAKLHGVENNIIFLKSNLLSIFTTSYSPVLHIGGVRSDIDIIVTNLPYIPTARIPYLDPSVKDFEPLVALDGGKDGFELYRKLFAQIKEKGLKPKLILGEIDYTHGELAVNEALRYFPQYEVKVKTDLAHKQRVLMVRLPPN